MSTAPKARVNITLDVETGDAKAKKELPLKLLMLGNYSGKKQRTPIGLRERISINKNNFNQVLNDFSPELAFTVPNHIKQDGSELKIQLDFKHIRDFSPEFLVKQVPTLRKLVAMRNLLKELRSNVIDNHELRKGLEEIVTSEEKLAALKQELLFISQESSDE